MGKPGGGGTFLGGSRGQSCLGSEGDFWEVLPRKLIKLAHRVPSTIPLKKYINYANIEELLALHCKTPDLSVSL